MSEQEAKTMDAYAELAKQDLADTFDGNMVRSIADWWNKWYLGAGHKRLGRILVDIARS